MSEYDKFENPCDDCNRRINAYCKAYKRPIKQIDISKCKKRETGKRKR